MVHRRDVLKAAGATAGAALLAGCLGDDDNDDAELEEGLDVDLDELPEEEITISHSFAPVMEDHWHRASVSFKQYMENATDGRFQVDISTGAELGGNIEQLEQTQEGTIEGTTSHSEGQLAPFNANFNSFTIPYLFQNIEIAQQVMNGQFGQRLWNNLREENNLRIVGSWDNGGFRTFSTGGETITTADDFEGLQMRVMPIESLEEMTRELGAEPEAIDGAELFESLDQGVVDGQENSMVTVMATDIYEVQEYLFLNRHTYSMNWLIFSETWFQDLHPAYQQMVEIAGRHAAADARRVNRLQRERALDYLDDHMEIYTPDQDVIDDIRDTTLEPVEQVIRDVVDDETFVDDLFDAIDEAEEELGYN